MSLCLRFVGTRFGLVVQATTGTLPGHYDGTRRGGLSGTTDGDFEVNRSAASSCSWGRPSFSLRVLVTRLSCVCVM